MIATQENDFEAENSLVGLQIGLEYNQPVAQSVFLTVFGRAGGYYNGTEFDTATRTSDSFGLTVPTNVVTRRVQSTEAFVADLGGRVNFQIVPNCLSTFIGYEASVIDGIALSAANVADQNFTSGIDTNNTLFFQAVTFGVNLTY